VDRSGLCHHNWRSGGGWSGGASLGGWVAEPTIGHNADGRLVAFVVGSDRALWHNWQLSPGGVWSGGASLGGSVSQPTIGQNEDGRLEDFVVGSDRALWHNWRSGGGWSGWKSLGG
jgi:hypothetical protein